MAGVLAASLSLAGCGASRTGHAAVAMDPAGRLLLVLVLCDNQRLGTLTLTDETTGTSVTVTRPPTPPPGGTSILTGPIADPRPEGIFDLLDGGHEYTLSGATTAPDSKDTSGTFAPIRFRLDDVVQEQKLRQDSVLTPNADEDGTEVVGKDAFLQRSREECG